MKTVKIEVELPAAVVRFLEDASAFAGRHFDIKEYIQKKVLNGLHGDFDSLEDSPFWSPEELKAKYGLDKLLEDY